MKDFEFSIPTKIIFGRQAHKQAGKLAAAYGKRVLILYGSSRIQENGLLAEVCSLLEAEGITWETFGGIMENPTLHAAEAACKTVRDKQIDMLLAIGGGSVIDLAKAVSIGSLQEGRLWDFYLQKEIPQKALPLGVILTMAATASEANCVSVLRKEKDDKMALRCPLTYPKFALLNPQLTVTVGAGQTAMGAVDIFSHAFERYFHLEQKGTLRTLLCIAVMKTVLKELPRAIRQPQNYEARAQLMWAATMAHSDMIGTEGVYACHAMSHILTGEFHMSHGAGLAVLMPAWCKYMLAECPQVMSDFAVEVWDVEPGRKSIETIAQEGIYRFQDFICRNGLPVTLREAGIIHCDSLRMAKKAIGAGEYIGENFKKLDVSEVQAIFELARG